MAYIFLYLSKLSIDIFQDKYYILITVIITIFKN